MRRNFGQSFLVVVLLSSIGLGFLILHGWSKNTTAAQTDIAVEYEYLTVDIEGGHDLYELRFARRTDTEAVRLELDCEQTAGYWACITIGGRERPLERILEDFSCF